MFIDFAFRPIAKSAHSHRWLLAGWCCALPFVAILPIEARAQSYTPEHPQVKAMVDRGINFLTNGKASRSLGADMDRGARALIGYAVYKVEGDVDHPRVQEGLEAALKLARSLASYKDQGETKIVYEASVAAVLLSTVDSQKYRTDISAIRDFLLSVQKSHGGFGYLSRETGDTSQVQYAMLAFWTMQQVDIEIPVANVEATVGYLRSTLDPSGAWGYQGVLGNGRLVPQKDITKSLSTAGAGGLLIAADILGLFGSRAKTLTKDEGIPDAFVRIDLREKIRAERKTVNLTRADIEGPMQMAVRYQNTTAFTGAYWYYYWRYSQERYESFLEIMEGKQNKSPVWYNEGVRELSSLQSEDGSWGTIKTDLYASEVCTSFSILFLIRSTQKAIGTLDEGFTFGGNQLPADVSNIKMVGDRIVSDAETSVENLLLMLETDEAVDMQVGLLPENLKLTKDPAQRREQIARLSRLIGSQDYSARRIAAKLLGRTDDLEVVPDLIFALTDEDPLVPVIAEESLRLLSRKLKAIHVAADSTPAERATAETYWKTWYLGLRPDYVFVNR